MIDSEFAGTARHLASRLMSLAKCSSTGAPAWDGDDVDPVRFEQQGRPALVRGPLDDGLLTGRAGIAVALAACYRLPGGSSAWSMLACQTMHSILDNRPALQPGRLGWQSGALGIARAAKLVGDLAGDATLLSAGRDYAATAVQALRNNIALCPSHADLLDGEAGHLAAVLGADLPATVEPARQVVARQLVAQLAERPIRDARGARWAMAGFAPSVVGLAHGGSGIALALSAAQASGIDSDGLIGDALRWEDGHYEASRGGGPDWRVHGRPAGFAWCHGAPGVGIAAAYRSTTIADPFAEISYARAKLAAAAHRPGGSAFDGTMCHGLTGVVELHLAGAEAWPSAATQHLRSARTVARYLTRAGSSGRPGWTCGVSGGRTPNVLVGLAGVALTLVRCHDPAIVPSLAHPGLPAVAAYSVKRN